MGLRLWNEEMGTLSLRGTSWMKATVSLATAVPLAKLADAPPQAPEGHSHWGPEDFGREGWLESAGAKVGP